MTPSSGASGKVNQHRKIDDSYHSYLSFASLLFSCSLLKIIHSEFTKHVTNEQYIHDVVVCFSVRLVHEVREVVW